MFRARAQHGGASSRKQRRGGFVLRRLGSSHKPHSANHRSNEQALEALRMIFAFRHPLAPTGRRDAGRRRRRLLWSRCDAGAIPCPGKWETDPQAQIRLGAHPRPGEESCCYLIAHGEVAQVRSLGNEARSTRAVSRRAEEVRDQQRTLSPGRQATKN